ncbi:hypothetical protein GGF46_005180 [Coemansia sp. RSA 552]|nr:hypothetical protein GGF46_005180 [Coemansia sp. RSA 552]
MTALAAPMARTLKIKTGAVKRLIKDREVYLREVDEQQARIAALRLKEGVEDADIRKQNEVLEETLQMIPHMERRIREAMQDLANLVASLADGAAQGQPDELRSAQEAIAAAQDAIPAAQPVA